MNYGALEVPKLQRPVVLELVKVTVMTNFLLVENGIVPRFDERMLKGLKYKTDASYEQFKDAAKLLEDGWGDCQDIAAYAATAGYNVMIVNDGAGNFHVVNEVRGKPRDFTLEMAR